MSIRLSMSVRGSARVAVLLGLFASRSVASAQLTDAEKLAAVGDAPAHALPIATDLSPDINRKNVEHAMRKVADWQLARVRSAFNLDWTFAALYTGFMATSASTGDPKYRQAMYEMGKSHDWQLGPRLDHADDYAVAQTYLELYLQHPEPAEIAAVKQRFDALMASPSDDKKPVWWWSDALFMAPPAWARFYKATGDIRYLDYLDHQWWVTSDLLYDPQAHLYSRDATFLDKKEANGKKLFWSRGNGWVMAGLVRVLEEMPANYRDRGRYVTQFKEMSESIAAIQSSDGLWRTGLLDADSYPLPEVSGSAFFAYALAWGVNEGILDRATYLPVVERTWRGLLTHIYTDGRLGSMQPVGAAPGVFAPTASYVFGVGAFLLAGSEMDRMAKQLNPSEIRPGEVWLDDRGQPIQAHGGGILKRGNTYFWFGEERREGLDPMKRYVSCYASTDLLHWKFRNMVIKLSDPENFDPKWILERPKVFYNEKTKKYVMYMHIDGPLPGASGGYALARVGIAVSDTVDGDYRYLRSFRPLGHESRDIGQFIDDDGTAYLITEDRPLGFHIERLSADYLDVEKDVALIPMHMEGGALVHYRGLYYVVGSALTGWAPNANKYATATKLEGPWSEFKDIAPPETRTYGAQSTLMLKVTGTKKTTVIFMGDIWKPKTLWDSRYLWMPLEIGDGQLRLPEPSPEDAASTLD
jgi:unsaturated rhamnogalacturonyl hydrolase